MQALTGVIEERSGNRQYIVINLRNHTAEGYASPDTAAGTYAPPVLIGEGEAVGLKLSENEVFGAPLRSLLP